MPFDPAQIPVPNEKPNWRQIVRVFPDVWRLMYTADPKSAHRQLFIAVAEAPSNALFTFSLKWLTDALVGQQFHLVWRYAGLMSITLGWQAVSAYFDSKSDDEWRYRTQIVLDQQMMQHMSQLPLGTLESARFATLKSALDNKMGNFMSVSRNSIWLTKRAFGVLGIASTFILLPWQAVVVVLAFQFLLFYLSQHQASYAWSLLSMDAREGRRGRFYQQAVNGAQYALTTKTLGLAKAFEQAWRKIIDRVLVERLKNTALIARYEFFSQLCSMGGFLAGLWFLLPQIVSRKTAIGVAVAFIAAYFRFSQWMSNIMENVTWFMREAPCFVLWKQFLSLPLEDSKGALLVKQPLKIELRDLWFRYPESSTDVLRGISFSFTEGDHLALIGLNGAGKSTLLKLLMRVYEPTKGQILVNGQDLWKIRSSAWREALAMLTQDVPRYDDILAEQVRYGAYAAPIDRHRLKMALTTSGFGPIAEDLPKKLKTHAGKQYAMPEDNPIELSGGQNQILAIARTLYRKARIYIFDEPTSAVDAEKEERFFEKLPEAMRGKSVIFVSHRFSTLRRAPRILVMDQGKIIEDGSHEELMEKAGRYAELFTLQAKMYQ